MSQKPKPNQPPKPSFWDSGQRPVLIAHRGGDGAGPDKENTLAAFKAARDAGYRYGETDVILTADSQVVAIHGASNLWDSLSRGRHSRRSLQRKTLAQLRSKYSVGGEPVPTLEELLKALPTMKFFIDPKTEEVVAPLAKLIRRLSVTNRVCVGSFNYGRVGRFRELMGKNAPATCFIIGRAFRFLNANKHMLETGRLSRVQAVQLHHSLLSRQMVDLVHQQGFKAVIWTANSEITIKNALNCGADGIISDKILLLKEVTASKTPLL